MSNFILEAENVTYAYTKKGQKALDGMSIQIEQGVKTAILGSNGAGKSTLFSVLNALYKPEKGKVLYKGEPIRYKHKDIIKMRSDVSILFQNPDDMMFKPYVNQDVAFGPNNMHLPKEEVDARVREALFMVGMEKYANHPIMKLSYGQRKRVSLAGVLAMKPSVLIMDEPTAGLDPQMAYEVMEIAEQLHSSGVTVIMSSHDTDLTYSWADQIRILSKGKCTYSGTAEQFYLDNPAVQRSGLMAPTVFLLNKALADNGNYPLEPFPKTHTQLSVKTAKHSNDSFGRLHILKTEKDMDLKEQVINSGLDKMPTGIYGLSARMARNGCDMHVDFLYNGPENCTMKCLSGQDSMLICDPLMVDKAVSSAKYINDNGYGKIEIDFI